MAVEYPAGPGPAQWDNRQRRLGRCWFRLGWRVDPAADRTRDLVLAQRERLFERGGHSAGRVRPSQLSFRLQRDPLVLAVFEELLDCKL